MWVTLRSSVNSTCAISQCSSVPRPSAHQCHISVHTSAHQCHISVPK
ncbi:unnamed protein product [Staurois parvus]|uniref:Uncharacterized protein n=1 Tax=Staurois parvus TaxID=386267 RepID=A0ABN9B3Y8_9NEOB|nr:unnamed protein product [Staurois parvus]